MPPEFEFAYFWPRVGLLFCVLQLFRRLFHIGRSPGTWVDVATPFCISAFGQIDHLSGVRPLLRALPEEGLWDWSSS